MRPSTRLAFALMTMASLATLASCEQSADDRSRRAGIRVKEEASTRESETVQRLTTPQDPHRILYHAPNDLSDSNAIRTNATLVGENRVPQPTEPSVHSGAPPEKPPAKKP